MSTTSTTSNSISTGRSPEQRASADRDAEFVNQYKNGDKQALATLIDKYTPLLKRKITEKGDDELVEYDELFNEALLGFMAALLLYSKEKGSLGAFAESWIVDALNAINRFVSSDIYQPHNFRACLSCLSRFEFKFRRPPTPEEILANCSSCPKKAATLENGLQYPVCLDEQPQDSQPYWEDAVSRHETLASDYDDDEGPYEPLAQKDYSEYRIKKLYDALETLDPTERQVIILHDGLSPKGYLSYEQIAALLKISDSTVCRIHQRAFIQLKAAITGAMAKDELQAVDKRRASSSPILSKAPRRTSKKVSGPNPL